MRRQPPSDIDATLSGILDLAPECTEELLTSIDQPLKVMRDTQANRDYLISDFNRDGDSYRSPWTSQYFPTNDGQGAQPIPPLRELEQDLHSTMETYRELYFNGGIQSSYVWALPTAENGFAACTLIKKECDNVQKGLTKGCWDSIHVFEVTPSTNSPAPGSAGTLFTYKLTTTIMLTLTVGSLNLSGNVTRQNVRDDYITHAPNTPQGRIDHIKNMGSLLEETESRLRSHVETLYFQKMKEIVGYLHSSADLSEADRRRAAQRNIMAGLGATPASLAAQAAARVGTR
eukprot:GAFH01003288.1.p2 GENE.GAFH01003288.1~~GAFH01003288.1.p2  ORF type:complete len:306 (-),score=27.12 GAFH01003288.1:54-917(-)